MKSFVFSLCNMLDGLSWTHKTFTKIRNFCLLLSAYFLFVANFSDVSTVSFFSFLDCEDQFPVFGNIFLPDLIQIFWTVFFQQIVFSVISVLNHHILCLAKLF